jgi:hypothetical protein
MELEFSQLIFEKHSNIKFYKMLSTGSAFDPCGLKDGQRDMIKLTVYSRNSAKALKKNTEVQRY